jgi:hypothetical protein
MIGKSFWKCFGLCLSNSACFTEWKTTFVATVMAGLARSNLELRPPAHNPNHRIAIGVFD